VNKELIMDAMEYIDDELLEDVNTLRSGRPLKRSRIWMRYASAAACVCIVLGGMLFVSRFYNMKSYPESDGADNEMMAEGADGLSGSGDTGALGVTIPKTEISIEPNSTADLLAFFIYDGRLYVQYEWIHDHPELAGEYVGTATGNIDCFTPKKEYVDFAGSVSGDFYTVDGFDPSFMLCMKYEDGSVSTYINDNGMTLFRGSDLFEDRLHLSGNYSGVEYQTRHDWVKSLGNVKALSDESAGVIESFVEELNKGSFMYTDDMPLDEGQKNIYDREIYHLFFHMNNGMTIHLRLYDGGYVRFAGLIPVCVKMDTGTFNALVDLLE